MMLLIEKIIRAQVPDRTGRAPLSFIKYSTPASGKNLNDKVIFFVFNAGEHEPFLCIKTVRSYGAKERIVRNFNNLKRLNALTTGSPHTRLFAEALYLYDDGEHIFSIETACLGRRVRLDTRKLESVLEAYTAFQTHILMGSDGVIEDMQAYAADLIGRSGLPERDQKELVQFVRTLPLPERLPRLVQHGDVTEDNLLWSEKGISIIDYDFVGIPDMPGFDIFGLLYRRDPLRARALCEEHLPNYFKSIGGEATSPYEGLLFLYLFIERVLRKEDASVSAERIISDFKNTFAQ